MQRTLSWPETSGKSLIDDNHPLRCLRVLFGKKAALEEGNAHSREIIGSDGQMGSKSVFKLPGRRLANDVKQQADRVRFGKWQIVDCADRTHAWNRTHTINQPLVEIGLLNGIGILRTRQRDTRCDHL